jgi:hypothetical protein
MIKLLRLKLVRCYEASWDGLLFRLFVTIGTKMFGCIAMSHGPDGNQVRAIHFAINQREFNISIRRFVERLDRSYLPRH